MNFIIMSVPSIFTFNISQSGLAVSIYAQPYPYLCRNRNAGHTGSTLEHCKHSLSQNLQLLE